MQYGVINVSTDGYPLDGIYGFEDMNELNDWLDKLEEDRTAFRPNWKIVPLFTKEEAYEYLTRDTIQIPD